MAIGPDGPVASAPDRFLVLTLRLRNRRRALGLTQQQVVRKLAAFGVTTTNKALSSLEHGAGIDAAKLPEFAAALDCTVTYLLGLTEDPTSWLPDKAHGIRTRRADHQAFRAQPDLDVLDLKAPPTQRVESPPPGSAVEDSEATTWILGPYLASVPRDSADSPGPD